MRLGADLPTSESLRKCTRSAGLPGKKGDRGKMNNKGIKIFYSPKPISIMR